MGTCKKCGSGNLIINKGKYVCKDCGHAGSAKEWITKTKIKK